MRPLAGGEGGPRAIPGLDLLAAGGLFLLALLVFMPRGTWFQGDDLIAVTYAREPGALWRDFAGPQYGLTGHTLFWRPLVTLSFAVEARLFGGHPFGYHLDNALVHALNAVLLFLLGRRLFAREWALRTAAFWVFHPAATMPVLWTVGRVDVHAAFWLLLSLLLLLKRRDGGRPAWLAGSLLAAAAGLATKEVAAVQPALAFLALYSVERDCPGRARLWRAARGALPGALLLPPWLVLRWAVLGTPFGGYMAAQAEPAAAAAGLAAWTGHLLLPLAGPLGSRLLGGIAPWAAAGGGLVALLLAAAGRPRLRRGHAVALLWFLAACVPIWTFLAEPWETKHLRYFYLPLMGLSALAAGAGRGPFLALLLLLAPASIAVHRDFAAAHRFCRTVHEELDRTAAALDPEEPLLVGEPRGTPGVAVELFLGLERLLLPPFGPGRPELLRWRPFLPAAAAPFRLEAEEMAFPFPHLAEIADDGRVGLRKLAHPPLPAFALEGGPAAPLRYDDLAALAAGGDLRLRPVPPGPGPYRVAILTGIAYLACQIQAEPDGSLSLRRILTAPTTPSGRGGALHLQLGMCLDVGPSLRTWLTAVRLDPDGRNPTARSARPLPLPFAPSAVRGLMLLPP